MSKCKLVYLKHSEIELLQRCLLSSRQTDKTQKVMRKLVTAQNTKARKAAFVPIEEYLTGDTTESEIGAAK